MVKENGVEIFPLHPDYEVDGEIRWAIEQRIEQKIRTQAKAVFYASLRKSSNLVINSDEAYDMLLDKEGVKKDLSQWEIYNKYRDISDYGVSPYTTRIDDKSLEEDIRFFLWQFHFESSLEGKENVTLDLLSYVEDLRDNRNPIRPARKLL